MKTLKTQLTTSP